MAVSPAYIATLKGDAECLSALLWIAERAERYTPGGFTPPITRRTKPDRPVKLIALAARVGRAAQGTAAGTIRALAWTDGSAAQEASGQPADLAAMLSRALLISKTAGSLIVMTGQRRRTMEALLSSLAPSLLRLGYSVQPCGTSGGLLFIIFRRGGRTWRVAYFESMTSLSVSCVLGSAPPAGRESSRLGGVAAAIYRALDVVSTWLRGEFGVAMRPTGGMIAMGAVRSFLPPELRKWRPTPLLVAMERVGKGYRGGLTYGKRYRGSTWKIDVNRQYTHALRSALPLRVAFGRYRDAESTPHGVFVCRLQSPGTVPYKVGVWCGREAGFRTATIWRDDVVCVLHTAEFPGLLAAGCTVSPEYGYVYTSTFDLSEYVERLQGVVHAHGKASWQGKLTKVLGNYVYGKLGQSPTRIELLWSVERPDGEYHPYWDDEGVAWPEIWERKVTRYTASQHVDVAATIAAAARSQTVQMWAWLLSSGATVVRCHTDSLTVDRSPDSLVALSDGDIGAWRMEAESADSIIVGANSYVDSEGAHVGGVSHPTWDMVERLHDDGIVIVQQMQNAPQSRMTGGRELVRKELRR